MRTRFRCCWAWSLGKGVWGILPSHGPVTENLIGMSDWMLGWSYRLRYPWIPSLHSTKMCSLCTSKTSETIVHLLQRLFVADPGSGIRLGYSLLHPAPRLHRSPPRPTHRRRHYRLPLPGDPDAPHARRARRRRRPLRPLAVWARLRGHWPGAGGRAGAV